MITTIFLKAEYIVLGRIYIELEIKIKGAALRGLGIQLGPIAPAAHVCCKSK